MWKLTANDLGQLRGAGGERFAHFVDRLIRAEAARGGLAQSEIETQLRVDKKDGGVDTQVKAAIPGDGWFSAPTCWRFKSVEAKKIRIPKDKKKRNVHNWYAEQLIKDGYAYRFCILGDLSG